MPAKLLPIFVVAIAALTPRDGLCADIAPPVVAGFDRFGRHGEVTELVSGQLLLAELNCTACHAAQAEQLRRKLGPRLDGAGDRLQIDWVRRFLESPHAAKPGTTMPDVLGGLQPQARTEAAVAIAAYLATLHTPFPEIKATGTSPVPHEFWLKGDKQRGEQLYHQVGCVACHEPDSSYGGGLKTSSALDQLLEQLEPAEIKELGLDVAARPVKSVPHGDLPGKYTLQSLTHFLLEPEAVRPGGRMPSLKLSPVEASDIAAYLLRTQPSLYQANLVTDDPSLIGTGRRLFEGQRCANCHEFKSGPSAVPAKPLAVLNPDAEKTCFGAPQAGLPHFPLDDIQTKLVRLAIAAARQPDAREPATPADDLHFRLLQLNCYACHERDKQGGVANNRQRYFETVRHIDLGDEGRLPPPLNAAGRKLQPKWLDKVLGGTGDVRPHLLVRMPKFPAAEVEQLPKLFDTADAPKTEPVAGDFKAANGLADAGRQLLDSGCVQCHPVRGESLPSVMGVDLAGVTSRVKPEWFHDFLLNPMELKPRTRMPTFFPDGKSSSPQVLDGNVEQQLGAIWTYLKDVERQPLPDKIVQAKLQDSELKPIDRPILLRTFMDPGATPAIAVGFLEKVNIAFDPEQVQLTQAWRGRFLDAHGTWFDRFSPPAIPLGTDRVTFPDGTALALLADEKQPWPTNAAADHAYRFSGYRLDPAGMPTFLYRIGHFDVEDRIEPDQGGLKRRLRITARADGPPVSTDHSLWFRAMVATNLRRTQPHSYADTDGLSVTVSEALDHIARIRKTEQTMEWLIPANGDGDQTIEVSYQW